MKIRLAGTVAETRAVVAALADSGRFTLLEVFEAQLADTGAGRPDRGGGRR